jgi:hypothetical protein
LPEGALSSALLFSLFYVSGYLMAARWLLDGCSLAALVVACKRDNLIKSCIPQLCIRAFVGCAGGYKFRFTEKDKRRPVFLPGHAVFFIIAYECFTESASFSVESIPIPSALNNDGGERKGVAASFDKLKCINATEGFEPTAAGRIWRSFIHWGRPFACRVVAGSATEGPVASRPQ